jgi:YidC/Oxa1 family membrane protein insertase
MEQSRLILAIALSFAVLFIWSYFFVESPPEKVNDQPPVTTADQARAPEENASKQSDTQEAIQPEEAQAPLQQGETAPIDTKGSSLAGGEASRQILVKTPLYEVTINEAQARFDSFKLRKYKETVQPDSPDKELIHTPEGMGTLVIGTTDSSIAGLKSARFVAQTEANEIVVDSGEAELRLVWSNPQGVALERKYRFNAETYLIQSTVTVQNRSTQTLNDNFFIALRRQEPTGTAIRSYAFEGPSGYIDGKLKQVKIKKIEENQTTPGETQWVAIEDRYFMNSVLPDDIVDGEMTLSDKNGLIENRLVWPVDEITPKSQKNYRFDLYFGPKKIDILRTMGHNLDLAVNFGWFDMLARPCLWLLNFLHGYIPNYGVAIIILTILVKVVLWPLGNKSYKSMNDMRKLQPLMAEIREKYKDDKKQMNQELMGLYRTYKINPMGGCLPMVVQIPVFFAYYRMLYQAIELRHAPFFLWINDLSAPDRLFHFSFSIPFMQPPYGIPVLTIVMGATMFLQQKMSPPPGDPTQAKMMMFMPLIFTFIFINFSSGLVLYWLTNNILSISQQFYIQKRYA